MKRPQQDKISKLKLLKTPEQVSQPLWKRFHEGFDNAVLFCRTTLKTERHKVGFTVSRIGVFEINSMRNIKERDKCSLLYDPKRDIYHVVAFRPKLQPQLRTCYTLCRSGDGVQAERLYERYSIIINGIYSYINSLIRQRRLMKLQAIVDCSERNPAYTVSHVASDLGYTIAFNRKNFLIMGTLNLRESENGLSPLMIAIQKQNGPTIKAMIACGASFKSIDYFGNTILHHACRSSYSIFMIFIDSLSRQDVFNFCRRQNLQGYTPIHWCCLSGNFEHLKTILKMSPPLDVMVAEPQFSRKLDEKYHLESISMSIDDLAFPKESIEGMKQAEKENPSKLDSITDSRETENIVYTDILNEFDYMEVFYGGCPLHWCRSRRSVRMLLEKGFSPDTRNIRRESPLHVFIRRRRFRCAVMLLAFGVDLNSRDYRGNAPIHLAVKKDDISMVQALLSFDADMNLLNAREQTPRHIAARRNNRLSQVIVNVLHRVGAVRCPKHQEGCSFDCAHNGKGIGTSHPNWVKLENSAHFIEAAKTAKISRKVKSYIGNENLASMVCFDGGGVRGLFSCMILLEIEKRLEQPFKNYFDWLVGTSSGALIASLVAIGIPLSKIRSIYYNFKDKVFEGAKPYKSEVLEKILQEYLGTEKTFYDVREKKLLVTAVLTDQLPPKLCFFRNILDSKTKSETDRRSKKSLNNLLSQHPDYSYLWRACRASGAAPTFFKPSGSFVDGGLLANNPTIDGLTEFFSSKNTLSEYERQTLGLVLSIGTGCPPVRGGIPPDMAGLMSPKTYGEMVRTVVNLTHIVNVLVSGTLQTEGHVSKRAEAWCGSLDLPYFRLNPPLSEDLELNTTDDDEVINGMWETKVYVHTMRPLIDILAISLENIAHAKQKKSQFPFGKS